MQDPDQKCRHFGILWHFMAFYGVLALLPKSLIGNQIRFFRFYPIFSDFQTFPDFPTSRFHNSILNIRAKNHTSERTIVPWTVIFKPKELPTVCISPFCENFHVANLRLWVKSAENPVKYLIKYFPLNIALPNSIIQMKTRNLAGIY